MDFNILLILKILITIFIVFLIPIYWKHYGIANFLWLSDIGLLMTFIALWMQSSLLISMAAVSILPFEIIWIVDYLFRIITRRNLFNITSYMFNSKYPLYVRSLSLFHIALPIIWIWLIQRWHYVIEAPIFATILVWIVLLISYFATNPKENINWVHIPSYRKWKRFPGCLWLIFLLIAFPTLIIIPMHLFFIHQVQSF